MKKYVNDETRALMEEQFADCLDFEQLADLYADFQCVVRELMLDKSRALTEDNQNLTNKQRKGKLMKVEIIFQKTVCDGGLTAWVDTQKVEIEVPDRLKGYHVTGGIIEWAELMVRD